MTLLTTFLDFSDTGVLDIFVDEAIGADARDDARRKRRRCCSRARSSPSTFSFLRPNDLVWNYVVGNYLKGETPPPFDLLYWNSDAHQPAGADVLPGTCATPTSRTTCVKPGKLTVCGEKVDLGSIDVPTYIYGSREDHIVPWQRRLRVARSCCTGKKRFVLGASGHIAGVINPPPKKKRSHWIGKDGNAARRRRRLARRRDRASRAAGGPTGRPGSTAMRRQAGRRAEDARQRASYKAIEPAPGRYVKAKA